MSKSVCSVVAVLSLALVACSQLETRETPSRIGERAPELELVTSRGDIVSLEELRANGPVLLVFYRGHW